MMNQKLFDFAIEKHLNKCEWNLVFDRIKNIARGAFSIDVTASDISQILEQSFEENEESLEKLKNMSDEDISDLINSFVFNLTGRNLKGDIRNEVHV